MTSTTVRQPCSCVAMSSTQAHLKGLLQCCEIPHIVIGLVGSISNLQLQILPASRCLQHMHTKACILSHADISTKKLSSTANLHLGLLAACSLMSHSCWYVCITVSRKSSHNQKVLQLLRLLLPLPLPMQPPLLHQRLQIAEVQLTGECKRFVMPRTSLASLRFSCSVNELNFAMRPRQYSSSVAGPGSSPAGNALGPCSMLSTCGQWHNSAHF